MSNENHEESKIQNPEELQNPKLATLPVDVEELEAEEKIMKDVEDAVEITEEDHNKKNYIKISPTFYLRPVMDTEVDKDVFKIFNPEIDSVEVRKLTDEEKHEVFVHKLKESKVKYKSTRHPVKTVSISTRKNELGMTIVEKHKEIQTNITINKFDSDYKQKRKRRNKLAKASRKVNRGK